MGMGEEHAGGAVATDAPEGGAVRRIGVFCGEQAHADDGLGTAVYEELVERCEAPGNVELFDGVA